MTRYHATSEGNVAYTAAEETERDAEEASWVAGAGDREAEKVRSKRDQLLAVTDFYALTDVTLDAGMTTYRQALRDISSQAGFPTTISWPTAP